MIQAVLAQRDLTLGASFAMVGARGPVENNGNPEVLRPAVVLLCLALLGAASARAQEQRFLRIGTGVINETDFTLGTLIASAISSPPGSRPCGEGGGCGVPGLIAVAQSSQGALSNLSAIGAHQLELGLAPADAAEWAFKGTGLFQDKGPLPNLRAIGALYHVTLHLVVRRDAGITQTGGLRGKRVSLGPADSGLLLWSRSVLEAYGLHEGDLDARLLSTDLALDQLKQGRIDAAFLLAVPPFDRLADLAEDGSIDILPIEGPPAAALRALSPVLRDAIIPEGSYPGVVGRRSLAIAVLLVADVDQPEPLIYGITRALWHDTSRALLARGLPKGASARVERALEGVTIPLHPGAARYYQEIHLTAVQGLGVR